MVRSEGIGVGGLGFKVEGFACKTWEVQGNNLVLAFLLTPEKVPKP